MPSIGGSGGGSDPTGSQSGMGSEGRNGGSDRAGTYNERGQRTAYASGSPTAYGVAEYSRTHDVPYSRGLQALQDQHINQQFAARRSRERAAAQAVHDSVLSGITNSDLGLEAQVKAATDLAAGKLGALQDRGLMSKSQASTMNKAYGGLVSQMGYGLGIDVDPEEDVQTPHESFSQAYSQGLVGLDGKPTAKGLASAYGGLASMFSAPLTGGITSALGLSPLTGGLVGMGIGKLGSTALGYGPGGRLSSGVGMANLASGLLGGPTVPSVTGPALGMASNLASMGQAAGLQSPGSYGQPAGGSGADLYGEPATQTQPGGLVASSYNPSESYGQYMSLYG